MLSVDAVDRALTDRVLALFRCTRQDTPEVLGRFAVGWFVFSVLWLIFPVGAFLHSVVSIVVDPHWRTVSERGPMLLLAVVLGMLPVVVIPWIVIRRYKPQRPGDGLGCIVLWQRLSQAEIEATRALLSRASRESLTRFPSLLGEGTPRINDLLKVASRSWDPVSVMHLRKATARRPFTPSEVVEVSVLPTSLDDECVSQMMTVLRRHGVPFYPIVDRIGFVPLNPSAATPRYALIWAERGYHEPGPVA